MKISAIFPFFVYLRYLPNNHKQLTFTSIVNIGAQPRPRGGGQVTQDPVPGQLRVGGGHGGGPGPRLRHRARQEAPRAPPTMSQALARSCPRSGRPLSQSAREQDWQPTRHHLSHQPGGRHGPGGPRADRARQPAVCGRGCALSVSESGSWCCHCPHCCLSP